jgi:hypothetical protein
MNVFNCHVLLFSRYSNARDVISKITLYVI